MFFADSQACCAHLLQKRKILHTSMNSYVKYFKERLFEKFITEV
jgi:hypothetical protein